MELEASCTKTQRVVKGIEADIRAGVLRPGARLLAMRDMAVRFGVSFTIVNAAYERLAAEGLILRQPRSGVVVNPRLRPSKTKLLGLVTSYGRDDIESYYEPLFEVAERKRIVPMIAKVSQNGDWRQTVGDLVDRQPDGLLVDVEAWWFPLAQIREMVGSAPVCFCNRWEWRPETPERAVLTDYAWAYGEGLRHLRTRGHERVAVLSASHHPAFLEEYMERAAASAGMAFGDNLLQLSPVDAKERPKILDRFKPTAIMSVSDFWLRQLLECRPNLAGLELLGFFDTRHSRLPGMEFNSFRIDFSKIWEAAAASFDAAASVKYVKPELVFRGGKE